MSGEILRVGRVDLNRHLPFRSASFGGGGDSQGEGLETAAIQLADSFVSLSSGGPALGQSRGEGSEKVAS
jgi:hypothetical protein